MHYLIAAVILVLSAMGIAWVVAAVAAAIAVPSIVALRPIQAMLGPGPAMSGLYVVLHAVIGALIGLWLGGRGAATTHCPPRPVSGSPPRGRATPAATGGLLEPGRTYRQIRRTVIAYPWRSVALGLVVLSALTLTWAPFFLLVAGAVGGWIWYRRSRS